MQEILGGLTIHRELSQRLAYHHQHITSQNLHRENPQLVTTDRYTKLVKLNKICVKKGNLFEG